MIVVLGHDATVEDREKVIDRIRELGYTPHLSVGVDRTVIGCVGREDKTPLTQLESMSGVEAVIPIMRPFKLVSRDFRPEPTVVDVDGLKVGGRNITVIAGPYAVESRELILELAQAIKEAGGHMLRGGVFTASNSPYGFTGLREKGLDFLAEAREKTGLKIVSEILSVNDLPLLSGYIDVFQIGSRNCQNYALLNVLGQTKRPVLLKRGMSVTINEYLMAAEYILAQGNYNVILCERGIRTFERTTAFTLDLNAVPVIKRLSHLPMLVDPSRGTGRWELVAPMARAAIAAGADGITVDVHPEPSRAVSEGLQSLKPEKLHDAIVEMRKVAEAMDRTLVS